MTPGREYITALRGTGCNESIQVYATGLTGVVRVLIGTEEATVLDSAFVPGFAGLWQIDVRVPDGASIGGQMPVVVVDGSNASNAVTAWFE